jgi:hypothetical protein
MAINLGAMISAARSQRNPLGEGIANFQNQQDRDAAYKQMQFNNLAELIGLVSGNGGQLGGLNFDTAKMANAAGLGQYIKTGV